MKLILCPIFEKNFLLKMAAILIVEIFGHHTTICVKNAKAQNCPEYLKELINFRGYRLLHQPQTTAAQGPGNR